MARAGPGPSRDINQGWIGTAGARAPRARAGGCAPERDPWPAPGPGPRHRRRTPGPSAGPPPRRRPQPAPWQAPTPSPRRRDAPRTCRRRPHRCDWARTIGVAPTSVSIDTFGTANVSEHRIESASLPCPRDLRCSIGHQSHTAAYGHFDATSRVGAQPDPARRRWDWLEIRRQVKVKMTGPSVLPAAISCQSGNLMHRIAACRSHGRGQGDRPRRGGQPESRGDRQGVLEGLQIRAACTCISPRRGRNATLAWRRVDSSWPSKTSPRTDETIDPQVRDLAAVEEAGRHHAEASGRG